MGLTKKIAFVIIWIIIILGVWAGITYYKVNKSINNELIFNNKMFNAIIDSSPPNFKDPYLINREVKDVFNSEGAHVKLLSYSYILKKANDSYTEDYLSFYSSENEINDETLYKLRALLHKKGYIVNWGLDTLISSDTNKNRYIGIYPPPKKELRKYLNKGGGLSEMYNMKGIKGVIKYIFYKPNYLVIAQENKIPKFESYITNNTCINKITNRLNKYLKTIPEGYILLMSQTKSQIIQKNDFKIIEQIDNPQYHNIEGQMIKYRVNNSINKTEINNILDKIKCEGYTYKQNPLGYRCYNYTYKKYCELTEKYISKDNKKIIIIDILGDEAH